MRHWGSKVWEMEKENKDIFMNIKGNTMDTLKSQMKYGKSFIKSCNNVGITVEGREQCGLN